jgi:hypothetical protein
MGGGSYSGESTTSTRYDLGGQNSINVGGVTLGGNKDPMADAIKWVAIAFAIAWAIRSR